MANVKDFHIERGFYLLTRRNKPLTVIADECYRYSESEVGGAEVRGQKRSWS